MPAWILFRLPALLPPPRQAEDRDRDGLSDYFESHLAEAFAPTYYVSGGEVNNFAKFSGRLPLNVAERLGQTPYVHYRVKFLGYFNDPRDNRQHNAIKIEYYNLWDYDNGLVGNISLCGLLAETVDKIKAAHEFDVERSAVLVFAPTIERDQVNGNVGAYGATMYYTAAHEGVPLLDHSFLYFIVGQPIPPGVHIQLALTRSKHASYAFNPDGLPLVPGIIINAVLFEIWRNCYREWTNNDFRFRDIICLAALSEAYRTFYGCATEKWDFNGGQLASAMVNVGEPYVDGSLSGPIFGYGFIEDDTERALRLKSKFVTPITSIRRTCFTEFGGIGCQAICIPGGACF